MGSNKPCYVEGSAYERLGRGSTKINYIRMSISERNCEEIYSKFKMHFETLYLVLYYGDFKNEGVDELKYYNEIYLDLKKHANEISYIINVFKNNFTPETRRIAFEFISNGFMITEELTQIIDKHTMN